MKTIFEKQHGTPQIVLFENKIIMKINSEFCAVRCVCGQGCSKLESFLCVFSIRCCLYLFECFDIILHAMLLAGINILVGLNINLASELGLEHYCSFTAEPP